MGRWVYPASKAAIMQLTRSVDGGYTAMGPEGAVPAIPKLLE